MAAKYTLAELARLATLPPKELTSYQRRLVRHLPELQAGTLSRSQARGHARAKVGEPSITRLQQEKKITPLKPSKKYYKELAEKYHGTYYAPTRLIPRAKMYYHSAVFSTVDDAIGFAKGLPNDKELWIEQYGMQVREVVHSTTPGREAGETKKNRHRGEYHHRNISDLMFPDAVAYYEDDIRKRSRYLFDENAPSEYRVIWRNRKKGKK